MLPDDPREAIATTLAATQDRRNATRWAYYIGNHPTIYVTPKVRATFRALADSLVENYCGLAINSRVSRLEVTGWDGPGADTADALWTQGGFPQQQDVLYRWALVHGTAYLVVDDTGLSANPATLTYAEPDPDDWLNVAWAGKALLTADRWTVILWDETTVTTWESSEPVSPKRTKVPSPASFTITNEEPHDFPRVPVFPMYPYGYMAAPLLDQISPVQDRINKITANKFVAAEFGAFKQRVFFTRQQLDPYTVRQEPDHAIVLDPGDVEGKASVQELGATDLGNYDSAKESEVDALFTIATLPRHMRVNPGTAPSGEAIKADEGPFTEALTGHHREFGEAFTAALAMLGVEATPLWRDVVVANEEANARIVATLVSAGIPWQVAAAKYLGLTPDEIAEATVLSAAERTAAAGAIAAQTNALLTNPTL